MSRLELRIRDLLYESRGPMTFSAVVLGAVSPCPACGYQVSNADVLRMLRLLEARGLVEDHNYEFRLTPAGREGAAAVARPPAQSERTDSVSVRDRRRRVGHRVGVTSPASLNLERTG